MNVCRFGVLSLLLFSSQLFAQNRQLVEIQREVAALGDQLKVIQRTLDEKLVTQQVLLQQSLDASSKVNTSLAVIENSIRDRLREQEKTLAVPVTTVGTKVDQMSTEFAALRDAVTDINSKMNKLQAQMVDIANAIKTMQAPPPPPPGASGSPGSSTPPAGVSASALYDGGRRDLTSGNFDLAIQQFMDYIRYYPNTDLAPNAQFYIGEAYYGKGDMPSALAAFDLVLEKYTENNKTEDAMYMKGMALLKTGERMKAAQEFRDLLKRKPRPELDKKARGQLSSLGLSPGTTSKKR
jgi:tol-pal system protein YbgF